MKAICLYLFLLAAFFSCSNTPKAETLRAKELIITLPQVPGYIADDEGALVYMANHFWDNFPFADSLYAHAEVTKHSYMQYIHILLQNSKETAIRSLQQTMQKARVEKTNYLSFAHMAEKVLDNPVSPLRNEELYLTVLEDVVAWDGLSEVEKFVWESRHQLSSKNRLGQQAQDVALRLTTGKQLNLHSIKAEKLLFYFINLDCDACAKLTSQLLQSNVVQGLTKEKKLQIVAVYTDTDYTAWERQQANLPNNWIKADDQHLITQNSLYDLRAIPSAYVLDAHKRVLLKDGSEIQEIEQALLR